MKRWLAVAIVAAMLAVPVVSADAWMQPRGDEEATGFQPGQGPAWSDVALRVDVPGNATQPPDDPPPLILDDRVIFVALPIGDEYNGTMSAFSVDRDTGELDRITTVPFAQPMRMATDGETLYLSGDGAVHARPLSPAGHNWTWTWSSPDDAAEQAAESELATCASMTLEPQDLTVLCRVDNVDSQGAGGFSYNSQRADVLAARLDAETGDQEWVWRPRAPSDDGSVTLGDQETRPPLEEDPLGLAVSGDRVIVETQNGQQNCLSDVDYCQGSFRIKVRALDANDGSAVWDEPWRSPPVNRTTVAGEKPPGATSATSDMHQTFPSWGNPAASGQAIFVKADQLYKLNVGDGQPIWERPIGEQDVDRTQGDFTTAVALGSKNVYATSAQTVYRMDRSNPDDGWSTSLNFSASEGFQEDPIVTSDHVYAATQSEEGEEVVYAFDTESGDLVWQHDVEDELWAFSIGEGIGAYTARNTTDDTTSLVLLGRTEASPATHAATTTRYPDVGGTVEVDLSDTQAGAQGPITRYKAIWGDGTETGWQEDSRLNHTYGEEGEMDARFVVANEANQTNSTTVTFHVGQQPPAEPNWLSERFEKDNQDMTFGVLGVALALGGGAVGVARRKRRKSLLEDELEALEQGFEETREQPSECEALLDNRKARARSLALDDKLDEQQVSIIENRAEELRGELRVSMLDERFAFLPHGMVRTLERMLEDGRINAWEKETFLDALDDQEMLTEEQKGKVERLIGQWLDEGGPVR